MPLIFTYEAWSPWNKHLFADSLKLEVIDLMHQWYGEGFMEVPNPNKNGASAFVKIDDNRRVSIYAPDESKVVVDIVDLRLKKSLESHRVVVALPDDLLLRCRLTASTFLDCLPSSSSSASPTSLLAPVTTRSM